MPLEEGRGAREEWGGEENRGEATDWSLPPYPPGGGGFPDGCRGQGSNATGPPPATQALTGGRRSCRTGSSDTPFRQKRRPEPVQGQWGWPRVPWQASFLV